jgi:hypothetical protein
VNGSTSISPVFTNNFCMCGHPYAVHNIANATCSLCGQVGLGYTGAKQQQHDFTSSMEIWPASEFPQTLPVGYVSPGGFGTGFTLLSTGTTTKPSPVINFASTAGIKVGMTATVYSSAPNAGANMTTYVVLSVTPTAITVGIYPVPPNLPGTLYNISAGTPIYFQGADGSTMGPGLPPNGQRAG